MTSDSFKEILSLAIDNASDAFREAQKEKDPFTRGRVFAYFEILDTIKNQLECRIDDVAEYGLDVDLYKLISA